MSTSKHIDKICIAGIACIFLILIGVVCLYSKYKDELSDGNTLGYEDRLFNTEKVHQIDIVMDDWDEFLTTCENEEYSACTVLIDGEKYSNIGIRGKGNTSLSSVKSMDSERYSFKVEFDQYEKGKNYYGLDKLCLNNLIQDNTMMKDYLVYQMMEEFGVDAPLCSYAYITVNGEDWGLYLAVEGIDDSFLSRNYGSQVGELYKPDSLSFGGGGPGNGKDFDFSKFEKELEDGEQSDRESSGTSGEESDGVSGEKSEGMFGEMPDGAFGEMPEGMFGEKPEGMPGKMPNGEFGEMPEGMPDNVREQFGKMDMGMGSSDVKLQYIDDDYDSYSNIFDNAKTDLSKADKDRLISSLKNLSEYSDLEDTVDVEEVIRYFVVHNFVVNGDSYTGQMIHNYYLYEDDGQLSMIPWDYNLAFGTFQGNNASDSVNQSIDNPISGGDLDDRPMLGWIFSDEEYTNLYHDIFEEFVEKWCDSGKLEQLIDDTKELISPYVDKDPTKFCTYEEFEKGVETIKSFVSLRAEAVENQLSGDESIVDTGDLDLSDMGTMNNDHNQHDNRNQEMSNKKSG